MKPKYGHKSKEIAFNGITLFLQNHHRDKLFDDGNWYKPFEMTNKIMTDFLSGKGIEFMKGFSEKSVSFNANKVQDNFKDFKKYINKTSEKL